MILLSCIILPEWGQYFTDCYAWNIHIKTQVEVNFYLVELRCVTSVLMSDAPVTIEGHADTQVQGPSKYLRAILSLGQWWHPDLATAENHVVVQGPVWVEVQVLNWSHKGQGLGLQSENLVVSGRHKASRTITTWVAIPSTQSQDVIQAAANGHRWVCGPAASGVYVGVCGQCHSRGP